MTTANKITIIRILIIPVMIIITYINYFSKPINLFNMTLEQLIFVILFMVASFTDFLDGYIARKYDQITTFGKFLDPIADKLLVLVAMLYLMPRVPLWGVMVVLIREFIVTGIRLVAVENNHVIAASIYGKIKTFVTIIALIVLLFNDFGIKLLGDILLYLAIFTTLLSGVDYVYKNRDLIKLK